MDWPITPVEGRGQQVFITTLDWWLAQTGIPNDGTTAAWPGAGFAAYLPILIPKAMTVKRLYARNGGTVSGNCDVGLFASAPSAYRGGRLQSFPSGSPIISAGSTVQAGTSVWQEFNTTDKYIGAGIYWMGYSLDNTTGIVAQLHAAIGSDQTLISMLATLKFSNAAGQMPLVAANPGSGFNGVLGVYPILGVGGVA